MQIDGVKQVRLKGAATADWAPADAVFNGNWAKANSGIYDPALDYMRARVAEHLIQSTPAAALAGEWSDLTVSPAAFAILQRAPAVM